MQKLFPSQTGLKDTSYLADKLVWSSKPEQFVQIIFVRSGHWACLSNKFCSDVNEVDLYDSLRSPVLPDGSVAIQASVILHSEEKNVKVKTIDVQQQTNSVDCGLFALAFACDLCAGRDPSTRIYDQSKFRSHYKNCLVSEYITSFPSRRKSSSRQRVVEEVIVAIFCLCRQPERLPMVCCDICDEWFHNSCLYIPEDDFEHAFEDDKRQWICQGCQPAGMFIKRGKDQKTTFLYVGLATYCIFTS